MKNKNDQILAKLKSQKFEIEHESSEFSFSSEAMSKRHENEIRNFKKNEKNYQTQIEQLQLEIKTQKKVLESELGENIEMGRKFK